MTPPSAAAALLAALALGWPRSLDAAEAAVLPDQVALIQTHTRVDATQAGELGTISHASAPLTIPAKVAEVPLSGTGHAGVVPEEACFQWRIPSVLPDLDAPVFMGGHLHSPMRCGHSGLELLQTNVGFGPGVSPSVVVFVYLAVCIAVVAGILHSIMRHYNKQKLMCPEEEAWAHGVFYWIWMGWATQWISVWGSAGSSGRVRAEDMPVSSLEDDCALCFRSVDRLWREEVKRVGLEKASLLRVLSRFVTYRKVFLLGIWNALYDGFIFLGPPLAIEWVTNYIRHLYISSAQGHPVPDTEKVGPTLLLIAIFTGLPLVMIVCNTVSTMLGSRIAIRICGGLSCLIFSKGLRLPISPTHEDKPESSAASILANIEKENGGPSHVRRSSPEPEEEELEEVDEQERAKQKPKRFNLVQLVAQDVNVNVMAIPLCIIKMIVMVPVTICLSVLLMQRLRWAIIFTFAAALTNVGILAPVGYKMKMALAQFYKSAGDRLQFFQQVMAGIRFVKSSGGEAAVQQRLEASRGVELRWLNWYYTYLCLMMITITHFPRFYLVASLGGYCLMHGSMEPTMIWSLTTLLMSAQGAIAVVFNLLPTLVAALPSFARLETFLKLPEAPRATSLPSSGCKDGQEPAWVRTWPAEETLAGAAALRVQGSFGWQPGGVPALTDLNIVVAGGSSVAVVGHMGAGKTALLNAILGELYPLGEARIEVPQRSAYAAQIPHLFEGTLKENVLQGEQWDPERYQQALHAASLLPDLKVLPGGDEAPVGSRGIALSGGQKTRVSMARAAYCPDADVVLLDDPYGAVDACTAHHLDEYLLNGPLLRGRTRVVVCQPDSERLARFDWVLVLAGGRVVAQGLPQEVQRAEEYRKLLNSQQEALLWDNTVPALDEGLNRGAPAAVCTEPDVRDHQSVFKLREEECEGRASWSTFSYFIDMGGGLTVPGCLVLYSMKHVCDMLAQTTLARWTTHGSVHGAGLRSTAPAAGNYLGIYVLWVAMSAVIHASSWACGQVCQLSCSRKCHAAMVRSLLRAPTDGFFDRNPVGRIMNRMANDMMNMDQKVFVGLCSAVGVVLAVAVDLCYVHVMMPLWLSLASLPVYYLLLSLLRLYWKTMIPLRYLLSVSKSTVSDQILNVEVNNASTRAYGKSDLSLMLFQDALRKQISADFVGRTILMRWLCNRLFVLGGFFVTCVAVVVVWLPGALDIGRASLCVMTLFQLIAAVESYVTIGISAQYQIIAMNRLYEYTSLPEEREEEMPSDKAYKNHVVRLPRVSLGWLHSKEHGEGLSIHQGGPCNEDVPLLRQVPGRPAFLAVPERSLSELAPDCIALRGLGPWHRLTGANGAQRKAEAIAYELCCGTSQDITLYIESGWLADGVRVDIERLRVGYAGVPQDVLRCMDLAIPRRCHAAVVGKTGCGKSTLLLSLLRILEPRGGRVCLEGVDTQRLGLRTLRSAIGMVPQEPILLQGPLRYNLDPLGQYDEERIWDALRIVHLADYVRGLEGGLDFGIREEGSNLSFGQRQLMNLARNVLRRPMLLLLDEATSALDPHLQELLQSTISEAFPDSTMIVVAHRLETILDFDMVVVMHEGRVVEQGQVQELSQMTEGILAKMLRAAQLL